MRLAVLVAALAVSAGCLSPITERLRAGDVEEPRWQVGDWWTYSVTSDLIALDGEVTVVVAEVLDPGYIVGIPADAEANAALLYHMPAIGRVGVDLSWDVHGVRFDPARWPLKDGEAWDTTWISTSVHLTARQNGTLWEIDNEGFEEDSGGRYSLVYDPEVKWFTSFTRTDLAGTLRQGIELVASGSGWNGTLRAPQYVEVAFLDSRTRGVIQGAAPAAPNPQFSIPEGADTVLVGCLAGGAPGQYHSEVRAPGGGVVCALDATIPPNDATVRATVIETAALEGDWEARLLALGAGSATVEVLAWPTLNYTLGE